MSEFFRLPDTDTSWKQDIRWLRQRVNFRLGLSCLLGALILTLQHYFAQYSLLAGWLKPFVPQSQLEMAGSLSWCAMIVLLYLLLPLVCIRLVFKQSLADYGWSVSGLRKHWQPYALFYGLMLIPLLIAASTPSFQQMYPFFKYVGTHWSYFVIWQLAYGLQFVAVEFFFRGFLLFGLYRVIGPISLFLVMIPYCMIHFSKPLGESFGAIFAGLVLGFLALKNRSIWGGAALHWAVAFTMDLAAILF